MSDSPSQEADHRRMKVGPHEVDPRHWTALECPECDTQRRAYYLGTAPGGALGWVCGACWVVLEEEPKTGDVVRPGREDAP